MQAQETIRKIAALPPEAQAVVFDLLETLSKRYAARSEVKPGAQMKGLRSDPFIGIWRDRKDMADSGGYVRTLRQTEWQRGAKKS
jgi:hypothetical protein